MHSLSKDSGGKQEIREIAAAWHVEDDAARHTLLTLAPVYEIPRNISNAAAKC
jgi:hypothetical protein